LVDKESMRWDLPGIAPLRLLHYPAPVGHHMKHGLARSAVRAGAAGAHARWGLAGSAECHMPTHDHLALRPPEAIRPRALRLSDGRFPLRPHRAHRRAGPLCEGHYRALCLEVDLAAGRPGCAAGPRTWRAN
jgi:hypothetical protein